MRKVATAADVKGVLEQRDLSGRVRVFTKESVIEDVAKALGFVPDYQEKAKYYGDNQIKRQRNAYLSSTSVVKELEAAVVRGEAVAVGKGELRAVGLWARTGNSKSTYYISAEAFTEAKEIHAKRAHEHLVGIAWDKACDAVLELHQDEVKVEFERIKAEEGL